MNAKHTLRPPNLAACVRLRLAQVLALALLIGTGVYTAFAQTATPEPTSVPLVIPIDAIFVQANSWMQTLSPIMSLSVGIIIALAVFGFLAAAIKQAF